MLKRTLLILSFLSLLSSPLPAAGGAFEPEFAKLNTSDAGVLDPGDLEVALSYDFLHGKRCFDDEGNSHERGCLTERGFSLGLTVGLIRDMDLAVGLGYVHAHDGDAAPAVGKGVTDVELIGRWRPVAGDKWGLALIPSVVLPTGTDATLEDAGATQGFTSLGLSALYQRALGHFPLNLEMGYVIGTGAEAEGYDGTLSLNAALGWHALASFLPTLEANYSWDSFEDGSSQALALTFGLLFPTEGAGRFQMGASPLLWGRSTDAGTGFNLSWVYGFSMKGG